MRAVLKITFFSFLLCALFLASCKKDHSVLGVDVQPPDDALNTSFTDASPVYAHTLKYDSIASLNDRYKYLGINKDPYFGTTDAGLYLVPNIPDGRTVVFFGNDAHLTGSELILTLYNLGASYVGNANAQVTYSVFPVAHSIDSSKVYYSGYDHFHSSHAVLGAYTGSYTTIDGKPVLRIPMDNNFAAAVLNNPQYLVDNVGFQNTYKGFYIKCTLTTDEGIISQFDLEDNLSGFYLYYQNGTPSASKSDKVFRFTFGGTNPVRYTTVKHDFSNASSGLKQQVLGNDTSKGGDNLFLKGLGVSRARVYLPLLKSYNDSFAVAVNRAELIFNLDPAFGAGIGYVPPAKLCLLAADSLGREIFAQDQLSATDAVRYDGNYDVDNRRYVFNIARHVQAIFSGKKKNYGFYLVVANADNLVTYLPLYGSGKELFYVRRDNYTERVVLAGSNQGALKPLLNLSYVKFRHDH